MWSKFFQPGATTDLLGKPAEPRQVEQTDRRRIFVAAGSNGSGRLLPLFFLYALCGGLATLVDWGSFYIASYLLKWHYVLAVILSFSLGTLVNYISNKFITFHNFYKNIPLQFGVFLVGAGSALLLTALMMLLMVEYFHYSKMGARILVTGIMLFYNFNFHRCLTFGRLR